MPDLEQLLGEMQLDVPALATIAGVDESVAARWVADGQVDDDHVAVVADLLDVSPDQLTDTDDDDDADDDGDPVEGDTSTQRRRTKKGRKRRPHRSTLTADMRHAIATAALVATADQHLAGVLDQLVPVTVDDPTDRHVELVAGLLTMPPTAVTAIRAVANVAASDNQLEIAFALGQMERRELVGLHDMVAKIAGKAPTELPDGTQAVMMIVAAVDEIRTRQDTISRLVEIVDA